MHRRAISIATVSVLLLTLIVASYLAARPRPEDSIATLLYPKDPQDGLLWPTNWSWVWSISRLDASTSGESLHLVARGVHQPLAEGASPVIGPRTISKAECNLELPLAKVVGVKATDSAIVSVQLVDLGEIAAPTGKGVLRLLLHLKVRGATVARRGEESVIEGDQFVGQAPNNNPNWKDGELHLQTLFVRTKDRLTAYDLVVIHSK